MLSVAGFRNVTACPSLVAPLLWRLARHIFWQDGARGSVGRVDVWLALEDAHWQHMMEQA